MTTISPSDAALRLPVLSATINFRDLGGYAARDGRTVKWNRVYRSGSLHDISAEDFKYFEQAGLRHAYDLRSNAERSKHPNALHGVAGIQYWFKDHERLHGDLARLVADPNATPEDMREIMMALYRKLPYDFEDAYRELFTLLAAGNHPLVFNCAAGKDRTGAAAALLLTALDVPRKVIIEDYVMTEMFFERYEGSFLRRQSGSAIANLSPELLHPMLHADAAYLAAMFAQLEITHGSVNAYLRETLRLNDSDIAGLRDELLDGVAVA